MEKIKLSNVTLLGIDCVDIPRLQKAMNISQENIEFAEVKLLSSIPNKDPHWIKIDPINTIEDYSEFCIKNLVEYVETDYVLLVQYDGFVLNPQSWSDDFLDYDYIGAPWYIKEEFWYEKFNVPRELEGQHIVGNGGFCIRSKKFLEISSKLAYENKFNEYNPEDLIMCIFYKHLFDNEGIKFAPHHIAKRFSIEGKDEKYFEQFGFHGFRWTDISKWIEENPQYGIKNQFES